MNKKENPFINLLFNIILPVVILNHGHKLIAQLTPLMALFLALSFPVLYGLRDYIKNNKHKNILSIIGAVNILLTGSFALLTLEGFWFAVKEAAIPLLFGCWILASGFTKKSLMKWVVEKSSLFQITVINSQLDSELKNRNYEKLLRRSTLYLSFCFFFSAVLNFILGVKIFKKIDLLSVTEQQVALNEQIADMTWISFLVIGLPLTLVSGWTLWWFVGQLKKITNLSLEQIISMDHRR